MDINESLAALERRLAESQTALELETGRVRGHRARVSAVKAEIRAFKKEHKIKNTRFHARPAVLRLFDAGPLADGRWYYEDDALLALRATEYPRATEAAVITALDQLAYGGSIDHAMDDEKDIYRSKLKPVSNDPKQTDETAGEMDW